MEVFDLTSMRHFVPVPMYIDEKFAPVCLLHAQY